MHKVLNQAKADRVFVAALGVPLHAKVEWLLRVVDGFDDAVFSAGHNAQVAGVGYGLAVVGKGEAGCIVKHGVSRDKRNGMAGAIHVLVGSLVVVGQKLVDLAAMKKCHKLHPQTNRKHRQVRAGLQLCEQLHFELLAVRADGR